MSAVPSADPQHWVDVVRDHVTRTRAAQGLPPVIDDEHALGRIASLLTADPGRQRRAAG